jgi:hypothetical protein
MMHPSDTQLALLLGALLLALVLLVWRFRKLFHFHWKRGDTEVTIKAENTDPSCNQTPPPKAAKGGNIVFVCDTAKNIKLNAGGGANGGEGGNIEFHAKKATNVQGNAQGGKDTPPA